MILIGLTGYKGSGKSVVGDHLVREYGFTRVRFAGPLKAMLRTLGLSEAQIDGDLKEVPCDLLCGRTPRHAMQTLGTEWRNMVGRELWLNATMLAIEQLRAQGVERFVVDDVRFDFEAIRLRENGARLWRVRRPAIEVPVDENTHASEREWPTIPVDDDIFNVSTLDHIRALVDALM